MDLGIGVAGKEGYGTGTLGSGDAGGWRSQGVVGGSVGKVVNVAEESRIVVGDEVDQGRKEELNEEGEIRQERRKEKVEMRSRAVTSHTWNRVTMASGLLYASLPTTPVTGKVRLDVTYGFVSQPGLLGSSNFCLQCVFPHHPPPAREAPGPANEVTARRRWT